MFSFSTELKNRSSVDKNVVITFYPMVPVYQIFNRIIIFFHLDKTFMLKIMSVCQKEGVESDMVNTMTHSRNHFGNLAVVVFVSDRTLKCIA